jgi:hypothetical protein
MHTQVSLPMEERRNFSRLYNQMTLSDLNQVAPGVSINLILHE